MRASAQYRAWTAVKLPSKARLRLHRLDLASPEIPLNPANAVIPTISQWSTSPERSQTGALLCESGMGPQNLFQRLQAELHASCGCSQM